MPRKPDRGAGMLGGFIIDARPIMEEMEWTLYERVDQLPIVPTVRLRSALGRLPGHWLGAVCRAVGVSEGGAKKSKIDAVSGLLQNPASLAPIVNALGAEARSLLQAILTQGGTARYGAVVKQFGDEAVDSYFWWEHPPTSVIGRLRVLGLVYVGYTLVNTRRQRTLVVPADLRGPLQEVLDPEGQLVPTPVATKTVEPPVYELDVRLRGIDPAIWRRFTVPGHLTLRQLHRAVQAVMGWEDYHLYCWTIDEELYGEPGDGNLDWRNASRTRIEDVLLEPRQRVLYEYDLGDSWEHDVTVLAIRERAPHETVPRCLGGERACPPEDAGGVLGYYELLDILTNPTHPDYEERLEWVGDTWLAEAFSKEAADRDLMATARRGRWALRA